MAALNAGRALLQACKQGALADVKSCTARVLAIPNITETNPPIKMAMGETAYRGQTNVLRYLMASLPRDRWQGAAGPWDPVVISPFESLPKDWCVTVMTDFVVYRAAAGGATCTMQELMDAGLKLNHEVERLGSPLGIAIGHGKLDLVRFLLAKGANPNNEIGFPPVSLLHQAALRRSTVIMQLLLDHGATMPGSGALQGAAEAGDIEAAALALEFGADVNEVLRLDIFDEENLDMIDPALHVAVEYEQEAMVEFLLRRGARQDLLNGAKATAKALAVSKGNPKIIRLLQQHEPRSPGHSF
ncbi:hypothetical protein N0V86_006296 [Didymella sp. IMI 355093]|nr:hypothetical protein N0V86_006296 [Didymella sp. IMI 355093]